MIRNRSTVAMLLFAVLALPWVGAAFSADDGPIVNDYSNMGGADYESPEDQSSSDSSNAADSTEPNQGGGASGPASAGTNVSSGQPYRVDCSGSGACKAGPQVLQGYETFGGHCLRCHGQNAQGSTFAPSLVDAINRKDIGQGRFTAAVAGGMTVKDTTTGGYRVMPAWAENPAVMNNVGALWAYVKALADGKLTKPGEPKPMGNGNG